MVVHSADLGVNTFLWLASYASYGKEVLDQLTTLKNVDWDAFCLLVYSDQLRLKSHVIEHLSHVRCTALNGGGIQSLKPVIPELLLSGDIAWKSFNRSDNGLALSLPGGVLTGIP